MLTSRAHRTPQIRRVDQKTGRLYRIVRRGRAARREFSAPPSQLRPARLDNLAIVPASLLPHKAEWQAFANSLPAGSTVIVLPPKPGAARAALERISNRLSAHGSRVMTIHHDHGDAWEVRPL
ncbi:MAG: hypothetical protein IT305_27105 [Chloroflexi bacterium]|nr:hypothetical protein [Chloroflexota bacterium]